jgi:hypothetical protein
MAPAARGKGGWGSACLITTMGAPTGPESLAIGPPGRCGTYQPSEVRREKASFDAPFDGG